MPRFDTSFNFGANAPKPKSSKPASKPKSGKKPKVGGKSKSNAFFGAMHGS